MTNGTPDQDSGSKSARTRRAILAAARSAFAQQGYDAATIRGIAAGCGVDPALVIRYFGNKAALFAAATDIDLHLPQLDALPADKVGEALIRHFLSLWDSAPSAAALITLLRTSSSNAAVAARIREVFAAQVMPALQALDPGPDVPTRPAGASSGPPSGELARRSGLLASQLLGLALCRYVLEIPPLVAMSRDEIVRAYAPTLQRYASGAID